MRAVLKREVLSESSAVRGPSGLHGLLPRASLRSTAVPCSPGTPSVAIWAADGVLSSDNLMAAWDTAEDGQASERRRV